MGNYIKNLVKREKVTAEENKVRCKACIGCHKKSCRMGGTGKKAPCTRCEANDKENCVRKKCLAGLAPQDQEPRAPEMTVTDINLLPDHHPLRVRCNTCFNCKSTPCKDIPVSKRCAQCKAKDKKRCLMRICFDWTKYSITTRDIRDIEEQQAKIWDMMKNPPSKVLLLHKTSDDNEALLMEAEPVVVKKKTTVDEELNTSNPTTSELPVVVKQENLDEESDLTSSLDITDTKIDIELSISRESLGTSGGSTDFSENVYDIKTEIKSEAEEFEEEDDSEATLYIDC